MSDFYQEYYQEYAQKTVYLDMSSVLIPFIRRLVPGARVLDVGCGSGRDMLWLKAHGFDVTGFERSPGLADLARQHTGCNVIEGDFEQYDFTGIQADAVMLMGALVHIPHEKFPVVFANIVQGLKKEGNMLVSLKQGIGTRRDSYARVFYLWKDNDLREQFQRAGFSITDFLQQPSATGTGESWLAYVLKKQIADNHDFYDCRIKKGYAFREIIPPRPSP